MKSISETSLNVGEWRLICVTLLRTLAQGYRSFVKAYSSLQIIQAKGLEWKKAKEKEKKKKKYKLTKQFERSMNGLPLDVQMGT